MRRTTARSASSKVQRALVAVAAASLVATAALATVEAGAATTGPTAGQAGVVSSLPSTPSQVTVTGPTGLAVTVNQTTSLSNQTVSVSWAGGQPTFSGSPSQGFSTSFDGDYVQIFQCWSDPRATGSPGPQPTQCEFGGENVSSGYYPVPDGAGHEYSRVLSQRGWSTYGSVGGVIDPSTGFEVEPFEAVDGTTVDQSADYNWDLNPNAPQPFWLNPYFSFATTNEVDFSRTYADGTGSALFQVDTGLEAPGLGCGQAVADGGTQAPDCWLVVVPRATPAQENPSGLTGTPVVATSPLTPQAWANRIQIPLGFNPIGSNCSINTTPQQVIGSEVAAPALASWEPTLCQQQGSPDISYIEDNDDAARENLTEPSYGSVGMSVFTDPIAPNQLSPPTSLTYAPLTLSGVVVAFNIQRVPITESNGSPNASELSLAGSRIENIYLTPRLVAKLLTESYQSQFRGLHLSSAPDAYGWVVHNPVSLFTDPDFLQYNPEFSLLSTSNLIDAGNLIVDEGSSDVASALWSWVLADPAADLWLSGVPDPWGMRVNPYYSTNALENPNQTAFGTPTPETFPKNDPYCDDTGAIVGVGAAAGPARPICIQDWAPYVQTLQAAAQAAATANDGAKTTLNTSATPETAWAANGPQLPGQDMIISITTTADADRYGLQAASLSQSGDDGTSPTFIAPTSTSLLAGEGAMTSSAVPGVLSPDPATKAPGAYPLSLLTYAATDPSTLDTSSRQDYAALLDYAAGSGQVNGPDPGQLPAGFVPLPAALESQTSAAATTILKSTSVAPSPTPAPPSKAPSSAPSQPATVPATTVPSPDDVPSPTGGPGPALSSALSTATPAATPVTTRQRLRSVELAAVRTPDIAIGTVRLALPIVAAIGIAAALGALMMGYVRRRSRLATDPSVAGAAPPDPDGA